jgi:hypothetical protein
MKSGDKWIKRVITDVLKLDEDEGDAINRVTIDARRGEAVRLQVYALDVMGKIEILEIRESAVPGIYEAVVVTDGEELRIA